MKKGLLLLAIGATVLVSCNKNQKAVKLLDGEWTATHMKITDEDGTTEGAPSTFNQTIKVTFDGCKLKKDEYCTMTSVVTYTVLGITETDTDNLVYRVIEDGTKLEVKDSATGTDPDITEIVELEKDKLKIKNVDGDETVEIEYSKN